MRDFTSEANPNPERDFVMRTIENRDVHFLRCWFPDVLGNMKSFAVVPGEMEAAFTEGIGFNGSSVRGFATTQNSDVLAFPDAGTFQVLPWRPESNAVAGMFCDIKSPDGSAFAADSRHILMRAIKRVADAGYTPMVGACLEYFYFKTPDEPEPLDQGSYFDLTSLDYASDLRRDTVLALEGMGIPVEHSHHESAPSQHEIDLRYTDALAMADAVMTYKLVVKEIAIKHGVHASFMPKPLEGVSGSGMHVHMSLFDENGRNAFFDEGDRFGDCLSPVARSFIAGLLKHAKEMCLVTNQYVNSYKRLASGEGAASAIAWSRCNRSTVVRVPGYRPHSEDACRVEMRSPDSAANPYLAFAAMLSAGLSGIEEGLELDEAAESLDFFGMSAAEVADAGYALLPWTLGDAIGEFEASEFMREVLGEATHAFLVDAKRSEWHEYQQAVTAWDLGRYFTVL